MTDQSLTAVYKNWKGETKLRRITPISIWFGSTSFHKEPQWLLTAYCEEGKIKDFAMKDFCFDTTYFKRIIGNE